MKMEIKTNITDVPSTSGIVTMWLSKIKLASKEVAKGNHELYMRRRRKTNIGQIKSQNKEEKAR